MLSYVISRLNGHELSHAWLTRHLDMLVETNEMESDVRDFIVKHARFDEEDPAKTFIPLHSWLRFPDLCRPKRLFVCNPIQGRIDLTTVYKDALNDSKDTRNSDSVTLMVTSPPGSGKTKGIRELLCHIYEEKIDRSERGPFAVFLVVTVEMARVLRVALSNQRFEVVLYSETSHTELMQRHDRYVLISTLHSLVKILGVEMNGSSGGDVHNIFQQVRLCRLAAPANLMDIHFGLGEPYCVVLDEAHQVTEFRFGMDMHGVDPKHQQLLRNCIKAMERRASLLVYLDAGLPESDLVLSAVPDKQDVYTLVTTTGPLGVPIERHVTITDFKVGASMIAAAVQVQRPFMLTIDNKRSAVSVASALTSHFARTGDTTRVVLMTSDTSREARDEYMSSISRKFGDDRPVCHTRNGTPVYEYRCAGEVAQVHSVPEQKVRDWCHTGVGFCVRFRDGDAWCGGHVEHTCSVCGNPPTMDKLGFLTADELIITTTVSRGTSIEGYRPPIKQFAVGCRVAPYTDLAQAVCRVRQPGPGASNGPVVLLSDAKEHVLTGSETKVIASAFSEYFAGVWNEIDVHTLNALDQVSPHETLVNLVTRCQATASSTAQASVVRAAVLSDESQISEFMRLVPNFEIASCIQDQRIKHKFMFETCLRNLLRLWSFELHKGIYEKELDPLHDKLRKCLTRVLLQGGDDNAMDVFIKNMRSSGDWTSDMKKAGVTGDPAAVDDDTLKEFLECTGLHTGVSFAPPVLHHILREHSRTSGSITQQMLRIDKAYTDKAPSFEGLPWHMTAGRTADRWYCISIMKRIRKMIEDRCTTSDGDLEPNPFFQPITVLNERKASTVPGDVSVAIADILPHVNILCESVVSTETVVTFGDVHGIFSALIDACIGYGAGRSMLITERKRTLNSEPSVSLHVSTAMVEAALDLETSRHRETPIGNDMLQFTSAMRQQHRIPSEKFKNLFS